MNSSLVTLEAFLQSMVITVEIIGLLIPVGMLLKFKI